MLLNSFIFLFLFLIFTLGISFVLPKKFRILFFAIEGIAFLNLGEMEYILIFLFSVVSSYALNPRIEKIKAKYAIFPPKPCVAEAIDVKAEDGEEKLSSEDESKKSKEKAKSSIKQKIKTVYGKIATLFRENPATMAVFVAFAVAFGNEILSRSSIIKPIIFVVTEPFLFLCNVFIVLAFESLTLLLKKRTYWMRTLSIIWIILGLVTFIMSFFRITPFNANDFALLKSVFPILPTFLTWPGLIAVVIVFILLFAFLIFLLVKAQKKEVNYKFSAVAFFSSVLGAVLIIWAGYSTGKIPERFSSLHEAYADNGFSFCFSVSIVDRGIDKPDDYEEKIDDVLLDILSESPEEESSSLEDTETDVTENTPNVIFVQLESFCDMNLFSDFKFSSDPTPTFTALKANGTSGFLTVPSIGAGTANTEFEVLCGMSLKYFGAGEYPYETILQKTTNESICFNLKNHGYSTHAVHNYKANFYDRKNVFAKLGFDTFTSIEYMNGVEYNQAGWAKDAVLANYVIDSMTSTENSDFVYCITVQGHGKYPTAAYEGEENEPIKITSYPKGVNEHSYNYFVNQLHQTDKFIDDLISRVEALGEESIIVFYGDHVPNIGLEQEWLNKDITLFETEYAVWYSDGLKEGAEDESLNSYQLSTKIMEYLDFSDGVMTHLHTKRENLSPENYEVYLHMLQYDILYGDCHSYNGEIPFVETNLRMGIEDIVITGVEIIDGEYYIKGKNFTPASVVFINEDKRDAVFVDENTLLLSEGKIKDGGEIQVIQIADGIFHIGETEVFTYTAVEQ